VVVEVVVAVAQVEQHQAAVELEVQELELMELLTQVAVLEEVIIQQVHQGVQEL
jgi:hypothetical protein